jgi:S1-C subfamily serine protease
MENTLMVGLSNELAGIVQDVNPYVVSVRARRHYPSSGLRWEGDVIVTASHTVQRDEDITVGLAGGETVEASLVGRDPGSDLAVLKVNQTGPAARERSVTDPVKAGELALVVGRSPHSGPNASLGIISASSGPWQTWRGGRLDAYIRLDARLFPQSSGGAVVNGRGAIIGIATSALSRIAGLAIPVSSVKSVTAKLMERGFIPRGYLGIGVQIVPLGEGLRQKLSVSNRSGLIVLTVESSGPAEKGGILPGDIVLGANDLAIERAEDLQAFSQSAVIGQPARIKFIRGGALTESTIVIGERPGRRS